MMTTISKIILAFGIFSSCGSISAQNKDSVSFHILENNYVFEWDARKNRLSEPIYIQCEFINSGDKDLVISPPLCNNELNPFLLRFDSLEFSYFLTPIGSSFRCAIDTLRIKPKEKFILDVDLSDILTIYRGSEFDTNKERVFKISLKYRFDISEVKRLSRDYFEDATIPTKIELFLSGFSNFETAWTNEVDIFIVYEQKRRKVIKKVRVK